jgi:hypothetical protein
MDVKERKKQRSVARENQKNNPNETNPRAWISLTSFLIS